MRALFKLILWLIFLTPFALAVAAWFALSDEALVINDSRLSPQDIAHARSVLKNNDPRRLSAGTSQQITLNERDLNLAFNYLVQKVASGGAQVRVHTGFIDTVATLRVPGLPSRQYVNLSLEIEENGGNPRVRYLQLGALRIPPQLAHPVLAQAIARLYKTQEYQLASDIIESLSMQRGQVRVTYRWDPQLVDRARSSLLRHADSRALAAYHRKLLDLQASNIGTGGSLTTLLKPLFAYAQERSSTGDPIAENQALLTLLGAWASRRGLEQLVPDTDVRPKRFRLKLERRTDFAQHFLTSAALASQGEGELADAIGLYKEIADTDGGSGFSFTDIAADRAGTRFGELATSSTQAAQRVQSLLAAGIGETDIMPPAKDLPEHLSGEAFERRFGAVGSPAYQAIMNDIEQRIDRCRLYRDT